MARGVERAERGMVLMVAPHDSGRGIRGTRKGNATGKIFDSQTRRIPPTSHDVELCHELSRKLRKG